MSKVTLSTLTGGYGDIAVLNANFATIVAAFDNTVSRDGTAPNTLSATLDANSQRIINLHAPGSVTEPLRLGDLALVTNGVAVPTVAGQVLFGTGVVLGQDSNFFWDNTNKRLGIGNAAPTQALDVTGTAKASTSVVTPLLDSGTTDPLPVKINGTNRWNLGGTAFFPQQDTTLSLGGPSNRFANIHSVSAALYGLGNSMENSVSSNTTTFWGVDINSAANKVIFGCDSSGVGFVGSLTNNNFTIRANNLAQITISGAGAVQFNNITTTASAANAFLDNAASNNLLRSTSSLVWKDVLGDLSLADAQKVVFNSRAIRYHSKSKADKPGQEFIGFGAEWIADIDPRFVTFGPEGEPNWVAYPTYVVPLSIIASDHEKRISALEKRTLH